MKVILIVSSICVQNVWISWYQTLLLCGVCSIDYVNEIRNESRKESIISYLVNTWLGWLGCDFVILGVLPALSSKSKESCLTAGMSVQLDFCVISSEIIIGMFPYTRWLLFEWDPTPKFYIMCTLISYTKKMINHFRNQFCICLSEVSGLEILRWCYSNRNYSSQLTNDVVANTCHILHY